MIRINTDELDRLNEVFIRLKSDTDNLMGKTTMLRNEMMDDTEFMAIPKCDDVIAILDCSINNLISLNEDIASVETLMIKAKEEFADNENELVKAIDGISNKLDSIMTQIDSTINSDQIVVVDRSEELRPVNDVERLVAGSVNDLELTNITALSQLATSEIESTEVRDT